MSNIIHLEAHMDTTERAVKRLQSEIVNLMHAYEDDPERLSQFDAQLDKAETDLSILRARLSARVAMRKSLASLAGVMGRSV